VEKAKKDLEKRERVAAKDLERREKIEAAAEARRQCRATVGTGDGGSEADAVRGTKSLSPRICKQNAV
jgi:hypothetical protein